MTKKILIVDDMESRHKVFRMRFISCDLFHALTVHEAIELLETESPFDLIHLDRDMTDEQMWGVPSKDASGEDVANHIIGLPGERRPAQVIVHSWNVSRARWMVADLTKAGIPTTYEPFTDIDQGT